LDDFSNSQKSSYSLFFNKKAHAKGMTQAFLRESIVLEIIFSDPA
jgi:hypothetical protein